MDKYEYKVRSEEINKLINEEKYAEAVDIADNIDWRRVKNITMLLKIAALYKVNRRNEDCRAILLLAYDKYPTNRSVVYSLCEVSIELDDVVAALEYYKVFVKLAPRDNGVFTLRYRILEAQEANLEERIELLEELKKRDYQEEWAYELAYLYHRVGLATKCVEECDDIILFFGDGAYVMKAMELKMLHVPLTEVQKAKYDTMISNSDRNYTSEEQYSSDTGYDETYSSNDEYREEAYNEEAYNEEPEYAQEDNYHTGEGYTGEFYVEQIYDENGYPIQNNDSSPAPKPVQAAPAYSDVDMSQYNTINLQKVVAESMKELFPDDDIFAEENMNSEPEKRVDTRTYISPKEQLEELRKETGRERSQTYEEEASQESESTEEETQSDELPNKTGKVAAMVSNVSEASPEPDTGAIKKVFLPGGDARVIKEDADIKELRDTTESSVNAEHNRIQDSLENVYHEQNIFVNGADEPFQPMTGQMNLNDVLAEWEHIKKENVQKHQEAVMQHVKHQTGKIIANFDNSVKNEMIEEYEGKPAENTVKKVETIETVEESPLETETEAASDISQTEEKTLSKIEELVAEELGGNTDMFPQENIAEALVKIEEVDEDYTNRKAISQELAVEKVKDKSINEEYSEQTKNEYADVEFADKEAADKEYENSESTDEEYIDKTDIDKYAAEATYSKDNGELLDPEDEESIAEMAMEDALKTQEIKMNTADLSSLSDKILATTKKEANGAKPEEIRSFTPEEQKLFENFAVTKKIKKQILFALDKMTLAAYTGNIIITGEAGLDTVKLAQNLVREFQAADANFSGRIAKITGEKLNIRNLKEVFDKLDNGAIIIEKANGMTEQKLYEMAALLNQESIGIIVIIEDTKKEITKLLEKQAMIADYFNIRIDLMEMDNNALVAYAKNYALALEYSIDELGILALYTRISNMQGGNHVVTKDEVRDIIDEAIWKSKKSKLKNFVDVLFAKRYDSDDMIVLKERDFM